MDVHAKESTARVVCVDLDGSMLAGDLLWESFLGLARTRPWELLRVPGWLAQGVANLKRRLAERGAVDVASLPYREDVLAYLRQRREQGCRLVLTTAADEQLARRVAEHVGLFDEVIASDGATNLKGPKKLAQIEARLGPERFDYVGNGPEDLPLWEAAGRAIVVHPSASLCRRVRARCRDELVFERPERSLASWLRMLRMHQWAKNILLFVPLVTSHRLGELRLVAACLMAFIAFCCGASSIYILNDLFDLPADRKHARKRFRPLAAGRVSVSTGLATSGMLLLAAIGLALFLPLEFVGMLLLYLGVSSAYTFDLKRRMLVDVVCLAGLYTLRILAGGAAVGISISPWLMAFSMFLFLSLAFVKRYTELAALDADSDGFLRGRDYRAVDLDMIRSVGPVSGYLAVLVVCLYVNDRDAAALYGHPRWLWLLCPVILYWITRVWFFAQRGHMHSDPVVFALRDSRSLMAGVLCAIILIAASL